MMAMRVNVNGGHTPAAQGAVGYLNELQCDRAIKNYLIADIRARGHTASDSTSPDSYGANADLVFQANSANGSGAEVAASVHLNAGGGKGVEVWYYRGDMRGQAYAEKVSAAVAKKMGIPNRGAKPTTGFYWLNNTNMTAILVEVCFVDTLSDAQAYNKTQAKAIAEAIADGLVGGKAVKDAVNLQAYHTNSTKAQQFREVIVKGKTKKINGRICQGVRLLNAATGKYVDVAGAVVKNGANVQVFPGNGTDAQLWYREIIQYETDTVIIYHSALNINYVLDIAGGSYDDGANAQLYKANGSLAQQFVQVFAVRSSAGNPYYYLINQGSGKALDVVGGGR